MKREIWWNPRNAVVGAGVRMNGLVSVAHQVTSVSTVHWNVQIARREAFQSSHHKETVMFEVMDTLITVQHTQGSNTHRMSHLYMVSKLKSQQKKANIRKSTTKLLPFIIKCEESHKLH